MQGLSLGPWCPKQIWAEMGLGPYLVNRSNNQKSKLTLTFPFFFSSCSFLLISKLSFSSLPVRFGLFDLTFFFFLFYSFSSWLLIPCLWFVSSSILLPVHHLLANFFSGPFFSLFISSRPLFYPARFFFQFFFLVSSSAHGLLSLVLSFRFSFTRAPSFFLFFHLNFISQREIHGLDAEKKRGGVTDESEQRRRGA